MDGNFWGLNLNSSKEDSDDCLFAGVYVVDGFVTHFMEFGLWPNVIFGFKGPAENGEFHLFDGFKLIVDLEDQSFAFQAWLPV